jgi:hypothetical protein
MRIAKYSDFITLSLSIHVKKMYKEKAFRTGEVCPSCGGNRFCSAKHHARTIGQLLHVLLALPLASYLLLRAWFRETHVLAVLQTVVPVAVPR